MGLIIDFKNAEGDRWYIVDSDGSIRPQMEAKKDFKEFIFHPLSRKKRDNCCSTLKGFAVKAEDGVLTVLSINQIFNRIHERNFLKRLSGAKPIGYQCSTPESHHLGNVEYAYFDS